VIDTHDFEAMKVWLEDSCACVVEPEEHFLSGGWRPCPFWLCERPDHTHDICPECGNDLVTFMHEQSCSRSRL
jgi:hypothetical protein